MGQHSQQVNKSLLQITSPPSVMSGEELPVLYTYFRSSCSWRVRIALGLVGLDVDQVAIHLVRGGGEQHSREYREKNPMGQVPALYVSFDMTLNIEFKKYSRSMDNC